MLQENVVADGSFYNHDVSSNTAEGDFKRQYLYRLPADIVTVEVKKCASVIIGEINIKICIGTSCPGAIVPLKNNRVIASVKGYFLINVASAVPGKIICRSRYSGRGYALYKLGMVGFVSENAGNLKISITLGFYKVYCL